MFRRLWLLIPLLVTPLRAQQISDHDDLLREVLRRLDNLEQQNRELLEQVRQLKQDHLQGSSAPDGAPIEERVAVAEERIKEQAQTKVESDQKFPVRLYGTLLFNAFLNNKETSSSGGGYSLLTGPGRSGATLRQTTIGLDFQGPSLPGGGRVEGDLAMDFWAGPPSPSSNWLRIRRAGITLDWTSSSIFLGQDKPLISPYEPNSLAEVGVPSMAGSGNLWYWLPQARFQHKMRVGLHNGIDVQVAVLQTASFLYSAGASPSTSTSGEVRPALEGRIAFWHSDGDIKKFEIAPGFHVSSNRVFGSVVASRIGSVDWIYKPVSKLEVKGTAYYGENVAALGALGNGFYVNRPGEARAVDSAGGWTQLSIPLNNRVTLNAIGGLENDEFGNVNGTGIARSLSVAGNSMFHLSSNVLLSLEAQRLWTRTFAGQAENYNHYDLALAYLF